jgi:predicted nuclease of predicted toxin-antitoxin system
VRLYVDDDSVDAILVRLLRKAGHDVHLPADIGIVGSHDANHFKQAIQEDRLVLTHNQKDFPYLHQLVIVSQGHHPGLLMVRRDNDPRRDLTRAGIVRAIGNLLAAGVTLADNLHVLNQWR